ncbi:uncharacterized membrane protein At1g75140 [Euphorbia lathyris]|uniref:uncharacterized membrane protein At1g75140 n=1 Tax=Euphorbia lathyris TaxID=212925 RepID=UPI003313DFF1
MANSTKGKSLISFLYSLFILSSISLNYSSSSSVNPDLPCHGTEIEIKSDSNPQEVLLHKLEELVRNLSEVVAKLEAKLSDSATLVKPLVTREEDRVNQVKFESKRSVVKVQEETIESENQDGDRGRTVSVTKYSPFWSERFQFVSAVKLDSDATCINVLPFRDYEGLSKYIAVGDDRGRIHVISRNGDVLTQYYTVCDSPVTSMISYFSVYKNESIVVTGHQNGVVLMHKVYDRPNGEEWGSLSMENVGKFMQKDDDGVAITTLEVHHVGRSRYILSSDLIGKIRVFRENGTLHGSAVPKSRPVAFLKQRLLFLTETGAGSIDLKNMKIRESECEGLNHSLVRSYAFDATERSKAFGFTSDSDLIHVLLLGDIMNFKCRVRSKRKFDLEEPVALQAIKGYLLVINEEKVFALNVSSQHYVRVGGLRLMFSTGLDEIRSAFLNYQSVDSSTEKNRVIPLIASDREKLVVLGLGNGYVGMYRSNLPVYKGEFNTMLWTSPVMFFILFLFGAWQFFAKKKEALTSWGPDDPFSSTTSGSTGPPLGSNSVDRDRDRAFPDPSARRDDMMDLRAGGLRGTSRRYASPTRYPGGATGSFRPSSNETNSRPPAADPNYRTSSELKYRGSAMESTGFPKRRDTMFANNQAVDDSS